jgi:hypothetical protein
VTGFKPGDRIKVSFEGTVTDLDDHEMVAMVKVDGESRTTYVPRAAALELVEAADDPSKDPIWTVREVEPKPAAAEGNIVVKFGDSFWLYPSNMGNGYGRLDWARVKDSKIVGSVPGTPAADGERQAGTRYFGETNGAKQWKVSASGDAYFRYHAGAEWQPCEATLVGLLMNPSIRETS